MAILLRVCMLSVWLFAAPWTVVHHVPLVSGISQARILESIAVPTPGDLPNPGIKPKPSASPTLAGRFFTTCHLKM